MIELSRHYPVDGLPVERRLLKPYLRGEGTFPLRLWLVPSGRCGLHLRVNLTDAKPLRRQFGAWQLEARIVTVASIVEAHTRLVGRRAHSIIGPNGQGETWIE
ncbi:MAG TPA: hypothetical protein VLI05_07050 [Candidatus Saccharimonadia bacterium]|nr:hypothetical protein [Candidatus Saccharimonadia bacterium]